MLNNYISQTTSFDNQFNCKNASAILLQIEIELGLYGILFDFLFNHQNKLSRQEMKNIFYILVILVLINPRIIFSQESIIANHTIAKL